MKKDHAKKGFTLIELLTVIAIIGILAVILIPVVGRVRESARNAQCVSNLRQLSMGASAYETEVGIFPYSFAAGEGAGNWWNTLRPYVAGLDAKETINFNTGTEIVGEVLQCPDRAAIGDRPIKIAYAPNENVMVRLGVAPRRMEQIREPSRMILFADATQNSGSGWSNTSLSLLPGGRSGPGIPSPRDADKLLTIPVVKDGERVDGTSISFRHNDQLRANVAFVDGHVETFGRNEIRNDQYIIW